MPKPLAKTGHRFRRFPTGVLFENGIALNETAYAIFELCDGSSSVNDIAAKLSRRYDCPLPDLLLHVETTLKCLSEAGLLSHGDA